ncbi:sugar transferase [Marinilabiliaceae bacterium JC017]|nr:sugar transferase [Marinilabiliaceae bacterium JC017]
MLKRVFDIFLALAGIIILTPLGVVISILIVLNSGLPVFFIQNRVGQHKKGFRLIKFRTMIVRDSAKFGSFDVGDSSRVTGIGSILRKLKLDELPQLFNVLKGEMSLVGPRPEVEKWVAVYPERWEKVLSVVPGITDNASIEFRREEDLLSLSDQPEKTYKEVVLPQKLQYYEDYVDNQSFGGDIKLIFKTIYFSLFK